MTESSVLDHEVAAVRPTRLWTSFARQVELRSDAPALVWHGVETSYQQLAELACRAQAAIDALGASPTDMLAVPATKSPGTIAVTLACLRAGRPVMLPSPTLPEATLRRLVAAAGCSRVVTADELLGTGSTGRPAAPAAPAPAAPDDVAFVLTTSGSTRLPKIVPISAGAVERFADWAAPYFGIEPGTAVLNYAPLNFDLCFLDVWATLHHGGRVVLVDPDTATRGEHVLRLLRDNDVQVLQSVPMLYQLLADAAGSPPAPLGAVRHAVFTGDHMPPTCLARLPGLFPGARLHHVYGCTETNDSFIHEVDPTDLPRSAVPLGRPLPGARAVVLDEDGGGVLTGPGRGELLVATPFQTAGYLVGAADRDGEDDPNEGRFVADPQADAATNGSATRFYRTGDIVRRDAQGRLFLEGRTDFQVKVRGTRVNTADVEQALLEHDDVVEAAVVALPDPLAGHLLHAVLRRAPGAALNSLVLRKHCAERLPLAAIPTTLRLADEPLPRTSTGKVDRRRVSHALADRP